MRVNMNKTKVMISGEHQMVPAYPGCPGSKAVKRSLLLLLLKRRHIIYGHDTITILWV